MARKFFGLLALCAVLAVGFTEVRSLSAQVHGDSMGMMPMMEDCPRMGAMTHGPEMDGMHGMMGGMGEDCPMMRGGRVGGHDGMRQEG